MIDRPEAKNSTIDDSAHLADAVAIQEENVNDVLKSFLAEEARLLKAGTAYQIDCDLSDFIPPQSPDHVRLDKIIAHILEVCAKNKIARISSYQLDASDSLRYIFTCVAADGEITTITLRLTIKPEIATPILAEKQREQAAKAARDLVTQIEIEGEIITGHQIRNFIELVQLGDQQLIQYLLTTQKLGGSHFLNWLLDIPAQDISLIEMRYLKGQGLITDRYLIQIIENQDSPIDTPVVSDLTSGKKIDHTNLPTVEAEIVITCIALYYAPSEILSLLTDSRVQETRYVKTLETNTDILGDDTIIAQPELVDQHPLPITDFSWLNQVKYESGKKLEAKAAKILTTDTIMIQVPGWNIPFLIQKPKDLEDWERQLQPITWQVGLNLQGSLQVGQFTRDNRVCLVLRDLEATDADRTLIMYALPEDEASSYQQQYQFEFQGTHEEILETCKPRIQCVIGNQFEQVLRRLHNSNASNIREDLEQHFFTAVQEVVSWIQTIGQGGDIRSAVSQLIACDVETLKEAKFYIRDGEKIISYAQNALVSYFEQRVGAILADYTRFHLGAELSQANETNLLETLPSELKSRLVANKRGLIPQRAKTSVQPIAIKATPLYRLAARKTIACQNLQLGGSISPELAQKTNILHRDIKDVAITYTAETTLHIFESNRDQLTSFIKTLVYSDNWKNSEDDVESKAGLRLLIEKAGGGRYFAVRSEKFIELLVSAEGLRYLPDVRHNILNFFSQAGTATTVSETARANLEQMKKNPILMALLATNSNEGLVYFLSTLEAPTLEPEYTTQAVDVIETLGDHLLETIAELKIFQDTLANDGLLPGKEVEFFYDKQRQPVEEAHFLRLKSQEFLHAFHQKIQRIAKHVFDRRDAEIDIVKDRLQNQVWTEVVAYLQTEYHYTDQQMISLAKNILVMTQFFEEILRIIQQRLEGSTQSVADLYKMVAEFEIATLKVKPEAIRLGWTYREPNPPKPKLSEAEEKAAAERKRAIETLVAFVETYDFEAIAERDYIDEDEDEGATKGSSVIPKASLGDFLKWLQDGTADEADEVRDEDDGHLLQSAALALLDGTSIDESPAVIELDQDDDEVEGSEADNDT